MFAHFMSRHAPQLPLLLYRIAIGSTYKRERGMKMSTSCPRWDAFLRQWVAGALQGGIARLSTEKKWERCHTKYTSSSQMKHQRLVYNFYCVTNSFCILFCRGCSEPLAAQMRLRRDLLLKIVHFFPHGARLSSLGMTT